jgi:mannose-6-phosphate isomerase-like protein (cupin superfamily)
LIETYDGSIQPAENLFAEEMKHMNATKENAKTTQEITTPVADLKWEDMHPGSPQKFSVLWGDPQKGPFGMLLKQPGGGFEAGMHAHASDYHAVLVQGTWIHTVEGDGSAPKELTPGSYVFQPAWQFHNEKFVGAEDCIVYIHQLGKADFIPFEDGRPEKKQ